MEAKDTILSHNIKFLRKSKGFSQEYLAEKLNIKRSNVAAYETKQVEPRLRIILELAKLFQIDIKHLLSVRLSKDEEIPTFGAVTDTENGPDEIEIANVDKDQVEAFVEKTINIKKVLTGFKAFYTFKKSKLKDKNPTNEKLAFDIDSFIQLMEHLIEHNEAVIKAITSQKVSSKS